MVPEKVNKNYEYLNNIFDLVLQCIEKGQVPAPQVIMIKRGWWAHPVELLDEKCSKRERRGTVFLKLSKCICNFCERSIFTEDLDFMSVD